MPSILSKPNRRVNPLSFIYLSPWAAKTRPLPKLQQHEPPSPPPPKRCARKQSPISMLNEYCLETIFACLTIGRLFQLRQVCTEWNRVIEDHCRRRCNRLFVFTAVHCPPPTAPTESTPFPITWDLYSDPQLALRSRRRDALLKVGDHFNGSLCKRLHRTLSSLTELVVVCHYRSALFLLLPQLLGHECDEWTTLTRVHVYVYGNPGLNEGRLVKGSLSALVQRMPSPLSTVNVCTEMPMLSYLSSQSSRFVAKLTQTTLNGNHPYWQSAFPRTKRHSSPPAAVCLTTLVLNLGKPPQAGYWQRISQDVALDSLGANVEDLKVRAPFTSTLGMLLIVKDKFKKLKRLEISFDLISLVTDSHIRQLQQMPHLTELTLNVIARGWAWLQPFVNRAKASELRFPNITQLTVTRVDISERMDIFLDCFVPLMFRRFPNVRSMTHIVLPTYQKRNWFGRTCTRPIAKRLPKLMTRLVSHETPLTSLIDWQHLTEFRVLWHQELAVYLNAVHQTDRVREHGTNKADRHHRCAHHNSTGMAWQRTVLLPELVSSDSNQPYPQYRFEKQHWRLTYLY